ncbi:MAG: DUF3054 family protein [Chloroflexi bacterium]|nr:DUF3054 family protein [Chloroflexota bacterium]
MRPTCFPSFWILAAGDLVVLAVVTVVGFARHGELAGAGLRIFTTFLPLCVGWGLAAPALEFYLPKLIAEPQQMWRTLLAAVLAVPLAAWLRGIWLNSFIDPIFILVLCAVVAFGMLVWRSAWILLDQRLVKHG